MNSRRPAGGALSAGYLSLRGLVKSYDGRARAVDGVSLDIARGKFVTLLGPSGSGKTTTLIAGFEEPTAGAILLDGRPLLGTPPYRRNVGVVFQSYAVFIMKVATATHFGDSVLLAGAAGGQALCVRVPGARLAHAAEAHEIFIGWHAEDVHVILHA